MCERVVSMLIQPDRTEARIYRSSVKAADYVSFRASLVAQLSA